MALLAFCTRQLVLNNFFVCVQRQEHGNKGFVMPMERLCAIIAVYFTSNEDVVRRIVAEVIGLGVLPDEEVLNGVDVLETV